MELKPEYHEFIFVEEIGKDLLTKVKEIERKDIWDGTNGVTRLGSSIWVSMRSIMHSTRKYS